MNNIAVYSLIFFALLLLELVYFKLADHFNIIDKPNERSSHSSIVLRGGGIIFTLSLWLLMGYKMWGLGFGISDCYPWTILGITLASGISFVDDLKDVPQWLRLLVHFIGMGLIFYELDILHLEMWWIVALCLFVNVGATNVYNFMDGINGITGAYSLAVLIPLILANGDGYESEVLADFGGDGYISPSYLYVTTLSVIVFCLFNFRPKGKARCFAGDVGSIGIAFILLFAIAKLAIKTGDVCWLIFLIVYGVDGVMTICHRILLHENLGQAHRKHAYQLMANELKMSHITVSLFYMGLQLAISLGFIYLCPNNPSAHWIYLLSVLLILCIAYLLFMKKYYHLHEEWLAGRRR